MRSHDVVLNDLERLEQYNVRKTNTSKIRRSNRNNQDIPHVSHRKANPQAPLNPKIEIIEDSPASIEAVEAAIDALDNAEDNTPQDLKQAFRERIEEALDKVVQKKGKREYVKGKFDYALSLAKDPLEFVHDVFNNPYKKIFEVFQFEGWEKPEQFINTTEYAFFAAKGVDMLGNGVNLIVMGIQYREAKSLLVEMEKEFEINPSPELKTKIKSLRKFLKLQREEIKSKLIVFSAAFVSTALASISRAKKVIEPLAPMLMTTVGYVAPFLEVLWKGIGLMRAEKAKEKYDLWKVQIAGDQKDGTHAEELLLKRQERMILRRIPYEELKRRVKEAQNNPVVLMRQQDETRSELKARVYKETYKEALGAICAES
jgi:hypothetical protein